MAKKAAVETAAVAAVASIIAINKGIAPPASAASDTGSQLREALTNLKVSVSNAAECEYIDVPKSADLQLKYLLTRFPKKTFTTQTLPEGGKRVWKIRAPVAAAAAEAPAANA